MKIFFNFNGMENTTNERFYIIMKYLYIPLLGIFISGCHGHYQQELGSNFYYADDGLNRKEIYGNFSKDPSIFPEIIQFGYDDNYIIALQRPDYNVCREYLGFELRCDTNRFPISASNEQMENVADSILRCDTLYIKMFSNDFNYWIINKKTRELHGPYNLEEYIIMKRELNVSDKISIQY